MELRGRRIHIAGSAGSSTPVDHLRYGHELIAQLVRALTAEGAVFGVGAGKEPHLDDDTQLPALHFDWTVMQTAYENREVQQRTAPCSGRLITTVVTDKTDRQIPADRRTLWEKLIADDALDARHAPEGWYSAAYRRKELARHCDLAILLSGGEGVEQLAYEYAAQGKPVIPLDLDLGASTNDGSGGASRLAKRMRESPAQFVRLRDPGAAGGLLLRMATRQGTTPVGEVVRAILDLLHALTPPSAFFVRLLNRAVEYFDEVERYFARVVDPVVRRHGYEPAVMGAVENTHAWMNAQIFARIAESGLVVVDLTGVRPNCFIELGYALRGDAPVLITSREGTPSQFDIHALEACLWNDRTDDRVRQDEFEFYWKRNLRRPAIVEPREVR
jgi:nucleoside 2-deoxyribosyltransferase